jgi:hypothetical protein
VTGTLVNIDDETNYLVFQMDVTSAAAPGNITQQTHDYSYDET